MPDALLDSVVHQFLDDWFRDPGVGSELASSATAPLAEVLLAGAQKAAEELEVDPDLVLRDVFEVSGEATDDEAAKQIAKKLRAALPPDLRNLRSATVERPMAEPPAPPPPDDEITPDRIHGADGRMLTILREPIDKAVRVAALPPERWTIDFLLGQFAYWSSRLEVLEDVCETERGREAIDAFRQRMAFESLDVGRRQLVADVLADVAQAVGFRGSSIPLGIAVHRRLQERYIYSRFYDTIVSEWWVHAYEAGRPVRRTITEHHRKVMRETGDLDPTFSVVEKARLTPFKRDKTRYLLWDVVDMTLAQLWEIKPIGSAAQGVIQETYYRLAYEFFAIHWICFGFLPTERLESGDQDYPLIDPFTGQLLVYTRFSTVLPFTCSLLPGLVLYGVMKKRHEELERVLSRIRAFVRAVQEIVRKVIAVVKAILVIALVCAVVLLVLVLLILIILLSALQPSPSPVPGLPPGGEGRDPVPVPDRERVPASLGAMRVVAGSSGVTLALEARPPRGQAAVLHFGTITVDALDVARVGPFVERLTGVLDEALEAMSTAGRGLSSGTAPNV